MKTNKKIRIIHFLYGLTNGGIESVLLNYFSRFNLKDYSLAVVVQSKADENCIAKFEKLGFKIYNVGSKKNLIKYVKNVIKVIKCEKPNIIHSHMNYSNFFPLMIAKLMKVPNRISHSHVASKKLSLKEKILRYLNRLVATDYMACGIEAAQTLFGMKNYENNKVYILNNAIDYDEYKFNLMARKKIRKELNILDDEILIGHVGRLEPQKNHDFIIDIFDCCYKSNNKYKFLLVGSGRLKQEIISKIESKNLKDRVIMLEKRNDVKDLLSAMDIFILPSLREGLTLAGLEAQASNLPCLFSDTITKEGDINHNIKYLSITNGPLIWQEQINNITIKNRNKNNKDNFKKHGFDINEEAYKLDNYYRSMITYEKDK